MIIKLTDVQKSTPVLIGTESVIEMTTSKVTDGDVSWMCTKIRSVGAMVTTNWVGETIEQIWEMINKTK